MQSFAFSAPGLPQSLARWFRAPKASASRLALAMLLLLALAPASLHAQSVTGTIDGFVTDSTGGAIPGASVTVTETATQTVRSTTTNGAGVFTVPQLQPGVYSVKVAKDGFSTSERSSIEIQVNQSASLTFALAVGSASQTVEVSGQEPLLNTDQVSLGTVIGAEEIEDLPLNGRQFIQLLELVPGIAPTSVSQTGSAVTVGSGAVNPAIAGGTNRSNLFFINGVFATNPTYTYYAINPSSDVVQEFQEQSHAEEAEFGQATGGTVSISTKAGTNQFHGSGYEFIRNDVFDARKYFESPLFGAPLRKNRFQQNQFGGTIGGPILKDKLFGFGYYEGYRYVSANSSNVSLPTAAELGGDFSALLGTTTIYDPATYDPVANTIQPFPGNVIPANRIDQPLVNVIKAFLPTNLPTVPYQLVPHPTATQYNYTNTQSNTVYNNQWGVRVDYTPTKNDLIYGQYFYQLGTESAPQNLPSNPFINITGGKNAGGNYVHTFSPTLVAQATFGWLRATSPGYDVQPNALALFNSGGFSAGFTANPGGVSMPFVPSLGNDIVGIGSGEGGDVDTVWQYSGSVNKQAGKHALKFGAALYKATLNTNYASDGEYFNTQSTWNPATQSQGEEFAGEILGLPTDSSAQIGNSGGYLYETVLGFYGQDTWKVSQTFTVNYGLRWDYSAPVTDKGNRLSGFNQYNSEWYIPKGDVDAPTIIPAGVYIAGDHIAPNDYKNFSPRLGFSYLMHPKTSVQAGFGIFFDNWAGQIQATQSARGSWPSGGYLSSSNTNTAGLSSPAVTAQAPFPGQSPFTAPTPYPGGGTFLDTKWRNPYSLQYNLQVEQQIGNSQTFSVIYAGSSTSRNSIQRPFNQPLNLGPTASEVFPYPNMYQGGFNEIQSITHLSYNSLQSKYEKRFSDGLAVKGAFTWSKDIDVGCADFWEGCSIQNTYDLKDERADSQIEIPIVMSASVVYKLPFGKGREHLTSGAASKLAGGWQVNTIFQHHSGSVTNPTLPFDNANSFVGNERYNIVAPVQGPRTKAQWFNTSAFVVPQQYTFGDGRRDDIRGPMYTDLDFSLFRTFTIYKSLNFEFRSEFFNVVNHPNFSVPNVSCNNTYNPDGTCNTDPTTGSPSFGQLLTQAGQSRQVQFAGKFTF